MKPQVTDLIPGSLGYTERHNEFADGHQIATKQKGQVQIKLCDDNGNPFIVTLRNVFLAPDLCDILFSIIMLMYLEHICLFY